LSGTPGTLPPDDPVGNIRDAAAAPAQHAHRHDLGAGSNTRHTKTIARQSGNRARDVRAMPTGGPARTEIAFVAGVAIAAVAITRHRGTGDEIVSGQDLALEIGVVRDARIENRHRYAFTTGMCPCLHHIDAGAISTVAPQVGPIRIVGGHGMHQQVRFDRGDTGLIGEILHDLVRGRESNGAVAGCTE